MICGFRIPDYGLRIPVSGFRIPVPVPDSGFRFPVSGFLGRFPFSQKFRKFRFGAKWKTFFRFARLENSQKKWNCLEGSPGSSTFSGNFPVGRTEKRFPFSPEPEFSEFLTKWKAPLVFRVFPQCAVIVFLVLLVKALAVSTMQDRQK